MPAEPFADLPGIAAEFDVSRESCRRLERYVQTLDMWRRRINLMGPQEFDRVWHRHIADSLQLVEQLQPRHRVVVDIGSGAGFPGLVLACVLKDRDYEFHLVESNGKKAAFLRSVVMSEKLKARVHQVRAENLEPGQLGQIPDLVTARALARVTKLLDISQGWVGPQTEFLFLKGQDVDIELTETTKYWNMTHEKIPSRTDSTGSILKLKDVSHVDISRPVA